jgi:8-oxo-dGTP pyrophosphatase MutT (NUDIX family)
MLPGGGREEGEDEVSCVSREVREETGLTVRVDQLLADTPAEPPEGTYVRWRTYRCEVLTGNAVAGGGEGPSADLVGTMWLPLQDDRSWPDEIRADPFLFPQLLAIRQHS